MLIKVEHSINSSPLSTDRLFTFNIHWLCNWREGKHAAKSCWKQNKKLLPLIQSCFSFKKKSVKCVGLNEKKEFCVYCIWGRLVQSWLLTQRSRDQLVSDSGREFFSLKYKRTTEIEMRARKGGRGHFGVAGSIHDKQQISAKSSCSFFSPLSLSHTQWERRPGEVCTRIEKQIFDLSDGLARKNILWCGNGQWPQ